MNNNQFPWFSVIIPQKDRAEYLEHTLKTCMIQDYPNFEIIVSDDCSEDNSVEVVKELAKRDSRIKLFAHNHHLGMRDNFEFALNQVKDGYVMALGGDDALLPGCIWRMYEILKESGKELLTWATPVFHYDENGKSILAVKRRKDYTVKILKSEAFLNKIAKTFHYQIDECPMFYMKGVASTALVNRVKSRTPDHCFYYCPTPDGFSGVVLAGEVEDYAYTDEPLSLCGDTKKSQGKNYARTDKKSRFESQQFFNDNIRRTMHKDLASQPYSPLTTLMTADYLLTARDLPGWPGKFEPFTIEDLLRASFRLMSTCSYDNEVLVRELKILREIAKQHNLMPLFDDLYKTTKRRWTKSTSILASAITNSIRLEGSEFKIYNIFDAALATNFITHANQKFSIKYVFSMLRNSLRIYLNSKQTVKVFDLPDID
jgi:glycosyltransferase involved in cell wall biosynthesis